MKRLNHAALQVGDIVLTTTTAIISKAIRTATRSDISHAMVYVEDRSVIDATGEGVHARNTQRLIFEDECAIHVRRPLDGLSDQQLSVVRTYLRARIGTQYSKREAFLTFFGGARQWSKKQFCSRLVAQAFAQAGIQLVKDPNFCSPADLQRSPLLSVVEGASVTLSNEEAALWEGLNDTPQMMRDATNAILDGARLKIRGIQTFDDLHHHLVEHPEDDSYLCEVLEKSGYLLVWKIERDSNPWQYDLSLMQAMPADEIEEYCWSVLGNEDGSPNRYVTNRGGYVMLSRQFERQFFRLMADLYDTLATLHQARVDVAIEWLEANREFTPVPSPYLRPHTPEWFAALETWDPPKAAMTREIVNAAGSTDVCSICGDEPARDYRLDEAIRPAAGVDSLKLCQDCLGIRKRGGEPFFLVSDDGEIESGVG